MTLPGDATASPAFNEGYTCTDPNDDDTCTCGNNTGCIKWDPAATGGTHMLVEGRVNITGCSQVDFSVTGGSPPDLIYGGKGLLYTAGNVKMKGSFLSRSGKEFVTDDLMGVLTEGNMALAESSGSTYMGAFFASGTIGTDKSGNIVGAMVSNLFCMGSGLIDIATGECGNGGNSADVYYTPGLADAVRAMGGIKSSVVYTFDTYEWSEKY